MIVFFLLWAHISFADFSAIPVKLSVKSIDYTPQTTIAGSGSISCDIMQNIGISIKNASESVCTDGSTCSASNQCANGSSCIRLIPSGTAARISCVSGLYIIPQVGAPARTVDFTGQYVYCRGGNLYGCKDNDSITNNVQRAQYCANNPLNDFAKCAEECRGNIFTENAAGAVVGAFVAGSNVSSQQTFLGYDASYRPQYSTGAPTWLIKPDTTATVQCNGGYIANKVPLSTSFTVNCVVPDATGQPTFDSDSLLKFCALQSSSCAFNPQANGYTYLQNPCVGGSGSCQVAEGTITQYVCNNQGSSGGSNSVGDAVQTACRMTWGATCSGGQMVLGFDCNICH